MIVQNKYGYYFIPQSSIDTYTGKKIISGGVHEDSTIEFILNNSKRIVHAGTGFGDFLPALRSLERVWAFEPNKENFIASLKTIEINALTNVRLYNTALNSEDCKLKITDEGVRSQISFDNGNFVEAACMDTIIPKSEHIDLIHLDIEGFEYEALLGAKELISRCSPIIVLEIDDRATRYNSFMEKFGYVPQQHLIYDSGPMVFVNTVYVRDKIGSLAQSVEQ